MPCQPGVSSCRISHQPAGSGWCHPLGISRSEQNRRKVACESCRAQRSSRKQGQIRLPCLLMLEQSRSAAREPAQDRRRPCRVVPSAASRGRQRRSSVQPELKSCCQANSQLLCREKAAVQGFVNEGDPNDPAPHQAGPRTQQMPISRASDSKTCSPAPRALAGRVAGALSCLPAPCQPQRPQRLRDGSTWVPAGVRSSGLEITRLLGLASPHRREQGNPCRACLLIHHQLIHLRPEVRTPGQ